MSGNDLSIMVIGSDGREDALVRTLANSPQLDLLWAVPGNEGMDKYARRLPAEPGNIPALLSLAAGWADKGRQLTVVGPEAPLADGIVDKFQEHRLPIIGPTQAAARIETSKQFALELMHRHGIPTGRFRVFTAHSLQDISDAQTYALAVCDWDGRVVIKANGLAAGKGVRVCKYDEDIKQAIYDMLVGQKYGGNRIVVMEHLGDGQEFSVFALVDRKGHIVILGAAQDHKRLLDGDQGPNTGGMGAYSPVLFVDKALMAEVRSRIIEPMVRAMAENGTPFTGFLYAGLMMTDNGPKVVEWNCRLGDPEAQVILPLIRTDLVELLLAADEGRLDEVEVEFHPGAATCVVLASEGYPEKPIVGRPITGIEQAEAMEGVSVFHAGTSMVDGQLVTAGGRVVGVTAIGPDVPTSIARAYAATEFVQFEGKQFRKDIGQKAL